MIEPASPQRDEALRSYLEGSGIRPEEIRPTGRKPNGSATLTQSGRSLLSRCASDILPEAVDWIWPGRLARGKHCCIAGEPGTGKSQLSAAITAIITMGGTWPCGEDRSPKGSVIILSAEDGAADTIVPRLIAAGANLSRVHIVDAVRTEDGKGRKSFNLQADLDLLEKKVADLGDVALVIVDPVSSYLGKTDSHKNAEVRGVLEPLGEMASRMRVAVLSITHFNKLSGSTVGKALHRFIGSIAFTGAPRTAFALIEDPEDADRRLLLHAKNNLAPPPKGLAFRVVQFAIYAENAEIYSGAVPSIITSKIDWDAYPVDTTADKAMAPTKDRQSPATEEAEAFLRELLDHGPLPSKQIKAEALEAGISWKTVRDAQKRLGIKPTRVVVEGDGLGSKGRWMWSL